MNSTFCRFFVLSLGKTDIFLVVATSQNACSPGRASKLKGSNTSASCIECDVSTYTANESATACLTCPRGTTSRTRGATACEKCTGGEYLDAQTSHCLDCPSGWVSQSGAYNCTLCQKGSYPNTDTTACGKGYVIYTSTVERLEETTANIFNHDTTTIEPNY